jgi:hypothetical protein
MNLICQLCRVKVVVGIVITKDGTIEGVQIVKGISQQLTGILVNAFNTLEGNGFRQN